MKVLLVTNMYPHEGMPYYGIFVQEQERAICKKHSDVEYTLFFINGRKGKSVYIKTILQLHELIKKQHFDLIHVHYGFSGLFLLKKLPRKIPVLITLHGGDIQAEQGKGVQVFFTKRILRHADVAITLNERMDDIARKYISKTCIVPCSVDTDVFKASLRSFSDNEIKNIVFPSAKERFVKNYPLFEQTIKCLENQYGIKCNTFEVKNMSRLQVAELYRNSDLMLMTSISEGSPQVVKEAMACNLPVISTNVGDVSYLLQGVKGSAVASNATPSAEELAKLCVQSLDGKIEGVEGRERILSLKLDDANTADRIYQIYQDLIMKSSVE